MFSYASGYIYASLLSFFHLYRIVSDHISGQESDLHTFQETHQESPRRLPIEASAEPEEHDGRLANLLQFIVWVVFI